MIKLIIFDWGKVLGSGADRWNEELNIMQKITGLTNLQLDTIFTKYWPKIKIGKEPLLNLWKEVSEKSNKLISPQKLMTTYLEHTIINKEIFLIAKNLKESGYTIVILSNESKEKMKYQVNKFNLNTIFDKVYCSGNLGLAKPEKRIFEYLMKDQKVRPQDVIFIDNKEYNIEAAKSLGINSILFKSPKLLRKELSHLLSN